MSIKAVKTAGFMVPQIFRRKLIILKSRATGSGEHCTECYDYFRLKSTGEKIKEGKSSV